MSLLNKHTQLEHLNPWWGSKRILPLRVLAPEQSFQSCSRSNSHPGRLAQWLHALMSQYHLLQWGKGGITLFPWNSSRSPEGIWVGKQSLGMLHGVVEALSKMSVLYLVAFTISLLFSISQGPQDKSGFFGFVSYKTCKKKIRRGPYIGLLRTGHLVSLCVYFQTSSLVPRPTLRRLSFKPKGEVCFRKWDLFWVVWTAQLGLVGWRSWKSNIHGLNNELVKYSCLCILHTWTSSKSYYLLPIKLQDSND